MGFSQAAPDASPAKVAKQEDRQTCLPVTIRVIETSLEQCSSNGGEFLVHGAEHGMLILVAAVESLTKQSTSMELSLNDGSGRMKARYYITNDQSKSLEDMCVGCYVHIYGNVRTSPSPHFAATGIRRVQSADEISYHMIETAHAALKLKRGLREPATPSPKKVTSATLMETPVEPMKTAVAPVANMVSSPPATQLSGAALSSAILTVLKNEADSHPEGSALASVLTQMMPSSGEEVKKALEKLVDDGEIFTTIDDEHFSCV